MLKTMFVALMVLFATPVLAASGNAQGEGDHGDHVAHHYYTDDDDGDGVNNWRDPINDKTSEANTDTYVIPSLALHFVNVTILFAVLFYFIRRPMLDTLRGRARDIRKELEESEAARVAAVERFQEMEERLASIMVEIDRMREDSERGAANEKEQLIERAHQESERIAQSAERNIRDEVVRAKHELRRDAVELAVKLAETTLRSSVTRSDQQRLAREFLDSVRGGSNV